MQIVFFKAYFLEKTSIINLSSVELAERILKVKS